MMTVAAIIAAIDSGFDVYVEAGMDMGRYRMIKADAADLIRRMDLDPDKLDAEIPARLGCEKTLYLGKTTL
jgi:hypothetical protein